MRAASQYQLLEGAPARLRALLLALLTSLLVLSAFGGTSAQAQGPWWRISSETGPTNLPPGGESTLTIRASNLGDAPINSSIAPRGRERHARRPVWLRRPCSAAPKDSPRPPARWGAFSAPSPAIVNPYEPASVVIKIRSEDASAAAGTVTAQASVSGGGAAAASASVPIPLSSSPAPYGLERFEQQPFNEDGSPASQAGSHPFQLTTTLVFNQTGEPRLPVELPKDLSFRLPPGLIGNPTAVSQCTMANFFALVREADLCPAGSVIGAATVTADEPVNTKVFTATVPVFNLVPARGEPARLGFEVGGKIPDRDRYIGAHGTRLRRRRDRQEHHRDGRPALEPGDLLGRTWRSTPQQCPWLGMRGRRAISQSGRQILPRIKCRIDRSPFLTMPYLVRRELQSGTHLVLQSTPIRGRHRGAS